MNKNRLHKKFKENNRNPRRGPLNTKITTINTFNYLEHTKGLFKKFSVKKNTLRNMQQLALSPLKSCIVERFFEWNSCLLFNPKGERENNCALQYASLVMSKFSVFSDVLF